MNSVTYLNRSPALINQHKNIYLSNNNYEFIVKLVQQNTTNINVIEGTDK